MVALPFFTSLPVQRPRLGELISKRKDEGAHEPQVQTARAYIPISIASDEVCLRALLDGMLFHCRVTADPLACVAGAEAFFLQLGYPPVGCRL